MNRYDYFSIEELKSLISALNESSSWSPMKARLLKEIREAYINKYNRLHSGVGGGE